MSSERSAMNCAIAAFNDCQREGAFPVAAKARWWSDEVTAFGKRVDGWLERVEAQEKELDAMLADYRRIGA